MAFRLLAVGHPNSLSLVKELCAYKFTDVQVMEVPFQDDDQIAQVAEKMKKLMLNCDGILYTHKDPYKLISRVVEHTVPCRYVDISTWNFTYLLLYAIQNNNIDIRRISIDSVDYSTIIDVYQSLNVSIEKVKPVLVRVNNLTQHFVTDTFEAHRQNYSHGLCDICITSMSAVYNSLNQIGIPALFLAPDKERYINEIRRLILHIKAKRNMNSEIVFLSISASHRNAFYTSNQPILLENYDISQLREALALFAQQLNAAMVTVSNTEYLIICSQGYLMEITNGLAKFSILNDVCKHTAFTLSIGIGYGDTMMEAKANADAGVWRAAREGGNRAYIIYSPCDFLGPIEPNEEKKPENAFIEHRLVILAESAGLSVQTIYQIDCMLKAANKKTFTSADLAAALSVSTRTASRILNKLEAAKLAIESGKYTATRYGRPARIMKALF